MHRSEKTDPTASERLVIFALPQKLAIIHKNGNFICRWREIMLDVSHNFSTLHWYVGCEGSIKGLFR